MAVKELICAVLSCAFLFAGCSAEPDSGRTDASTEAQPDKINMAQWQYNEEHDVYWQTGIAYCKNPADAAYENLGIYVPGAYMTGTKNSDGTYTCAVNAAGTVGGFTAGTAPIVIPVETPGYAAMAAPTGYVSTTASYTDAGLVYVYAGCRGREAGAPAGVTDLKAAIRYIRYHGDSLPGSTERIFSFGMSGGGQSALLGATGNSELYTPYLEAIGAVSGVSDAVAGAMCWCPITSLDYASEAYEWNLGAARTGLSEDMQALSDAMAERFALYINELGLTDAEGNRLTLSASEDGIYQAGSYYDYLKSVIETSLNHFLEDTTFPYTAGSTGKGGFGNPGGGPQELPEGGMPEGEPGFRRGGELVSSLLAVSCVTVAFCSNLLMVQDKITGARRDLTITPVSPGTLALGYYLSTLLSSLLICLAATGICLGYLAATGWFLTAGDVAGLLLDVVLLVLFGTALSSCVSFPLSTQGQASAVGTIVSAGYGFVCGAYMPISQFSDGLQKVISFLPGTYGTSLLRNHALRGVFEEMGAQGFPAEVVEAIRDSVDCNLYFFGDKVAPAAMYLIVAAATVFAVGLYVAMNVLAGRARK